MSPPLSYTVLSHLHAPVTVYGFILPIYLYHWWAVLFVPLAAQIGCMLDTIHTPDGSQAGNALTTATIFTLAALVHELASSASSSFSGFAGWFVSLLFSYIFAARLAHRKSNFTFAVFCSSVGIFAMAFQGVNGWSSTSASGSGSGSWQRWWPVGLTAAVLIALLEARYPCTMHHGSKCGIASSAQKLIIGRMPCLHSAARAAVFPELAHLATRASCATSARTRAARPREHGRSVRTERNQMRRPAGWDEVLCRQPM